MFFFWLSYTHWRKHKCLPRYLSNLGIRWYIHEVEGKFKGLGFLMYFSLCRRQRHLTYHYRLQYLAYYCLVLVLVCVSRTWVLLLLGGWVEWAWWDGDDGEGGWTKSSQSVGGKSTAIYI